MKILMVNRYGYPGYGSENYFLDLCRLFSSKGHKVIAFTAKDERNVDKKYAGYFVNRLNMCKLNLAPLPYKILDAFKTIYSFEAEKKIEKIIADTRPDIAHIHNIKRLVSPSVLCSIKKFRIPVVYTFHDYHLICPNYRLFSKESACEACKKK